MGKLKWILGTLLLVLLVGCGAKLDYYVNVDTLNQSIKLEAIIKIEESDYEHIDGGRERFISVVNDYKPKEFEFIIDEKDQNEYKFVLNFSNYEDYLSKYQLLTGMESKSTFEVIEYSAESPFKAYQNIKIEDDASKMFDWLKEALVTSGSVSEEYREKLINSQNYHYTFDNKDQYSYSGKSSYKTESIVDIIQNEIEIIIKKNNKLDFKFGFIIDKENYASFTDNFSTFINNHEIDLQYDFEELMYNDKSCMKYNIQLKDIDLNNETSSKTINNIFGDNFCTLISTSTMKSSAIKNIYFQYLDLQLHFSSLFNIGKINPAQVTIDLDGVAVDKDKGDSSSIEIPFTVDTSQSYGNFHVSLNTKYETIKYPLIIGLILFIVVVLAGIGKFGTKTIWEKIKNISKLLYAKLYVQLQKYIFEKEFDIKDQLVIGSSFIIQIKNIDKVHYGKKKTILNLIYKCIALLLISSVLNKIGLIIVSYIVMIVLITALALLIIIYRKNALHIELISGREYSFIFENKQQAIEQYKKLLEIIEKINENEDEVKSIFKYVEENGRLRDEEA